MVDVKIDKHKNITIFSINGEFYIESVEYAEKIWDKIVSENPRVIAINCSKIEYIDSSAIGILVKFRNIALEQGIELIFFDVSEAVKSIFETARLNKFFTILTNEEFNHKYLS